MDQKMIIECLKKRVICFPAAVYLVIFWIFISSCDSGLHFEKNIRIPGDSWNRHHIPVFELEITDTINPHDLMINLRNTGEFPRSNLFLFISARSPAGAYTRDTLELILAEPSGKWKGRGYGSVWQNRFMYRQNVRFPEKGTYIIEIEQAMRIDDLPGILDVGLRVERKHI
jgi:gliding motility-associated lipoprotein GldH